MSKWNRRQFNKTATAASLALGLSALPGSGGTVVASTHSNLSPETPSPKDLNGRIFKTLKIGMVGVKGSLTEKFVAAREAGFAGIEMNCRGTFPNEKVDMNVDATKKAIQESGLPVDGTVCSTHWQVTHSNPKAEVRATALRHLTGAIRDTHAVGGNSVLLVVGHGKDGSKEEIWNRSIENISKAVPVASRYGIHILVENVWNRMLYNHDGDATQTAEEFVKYVDEFNSPWVGMQFDIGNHWKYGSMGDWIRQLGRRIVKLDLKGFSRADGKFKKIGEGDLDWADVRKALLEIGYYGWAAAEVGGGDATRLAEVSANMDKVFDLSK